MLVTLPGTVLPALGGELLAVAIPSLGGLSYNGHLISVTFQGTIAPDKLGSNLLVYNENGTSSSYYFASPFDGDLRDKYLASSG